MLQSSRMFHATFNFILTGSASSPHSHFWEGGKATWSVPVALWELYEGRVTNEAPSTHLWPG